MIKVYAHRGYSGRYPENTMLAFRKAVEVGADGIELDVQLTKDGQLVVIHDEAIDRTTDGTGFVRDYTLEELRKFNAAATWEGKFGFEPIPTFEEYCAWAAGEKIITNIELKTGVWYYENIEEKTLEMVRAHGLTDRVLFSSFNHSSIAALRQLAPEIKCGALVEKDGLGNPGFYCTKHDFQCFHPGWMCLPKEDMDSCKANGIEVNVWTVNDMDVLLRLVEWGVDGLITNYPPVCLAYVKSLG
jgi:glycerophosphoryl diester phosphodiesterase